MAMFHVEHTPYDRSPPGDFGNMFHVEQRVSLSYKERRQGYMGKWGTGCMTKIMAIANQKGGVGKTTTAINLASFLEMSGRLVLLVDLDPQANATSGLRVPPPSAGAGSLGLLDGNGSFDQLLSTTRWPRLHVLPCRHQNEKTPSQWDPQAVRAFRATLLESGYDQVILDCPPAAGQASHVGIELADSVLVPVQAEYFAMEGLSQIIQVIEHSSRLGGGSPEIEGILMTLYDHSLELSREVRAEVRKFFPDKVFRTSIPRDIALAEASSHGLPVREYDIRARGSWAYLNLTKEVLRHE